jgi:hypothetical protein
VIEVPSLLVVCFVELEVKRAQLEQGGRKHQP